MCYFFFLAPNGSFINNKYIFVIPFVLFFFVLYLLLVSKEKDVRIIEAHKEEWAGKKSLGAILFPIIALIIMIIEVLFKIKMNRGII